MTSLVTARGLAKSFGSKQALRPTDLDIPAGRIVGVIGANGAGKSTLLNCLLGLCDYQGELSVLGFEPFRQRERLMRQASFIADVATLPRWARVKEIVDWVAGLHPAFDPQKAIARLEKAAIPLSARVKTLSKGMIVQTHLAIVLAIDARLLVLDEPTLGLDIVNRRAFYDAILTEYFDETRTIIITTHQTDEIEPILTHAMFIRDGAVRVNTSMEEVAARFCALETTEAHRSEAEALSPVYARSLLGRMLYVFDGVDPARLAALGDVRRVGLSDLFVALSE
jgi:ABC-2 type transport system ATP-binding protein